MFEGTILAMILRFFLTIRNELVSSTHYFIDFIPPDWTFQDGKFHTSQLMQWINFISGKNFLDFYIFLDTRKTLRNYNFQLIAVGSP